MILGEARIEKGLRVYAIGDIHGCIDQFHELLQRIDDDLIANPIERSRLVFLGDYVDRGPANKHVIEELIALQSSPRDCVFLCGNHDERFVSFIDNPDIVGESFLRWGGYETLRDYDVTLGGGSDRSIHAIASEFAKNVPASHYDFISALPYYLTIGDYFFCHAGVRPGIQLGEQSKADLVWIRADFLNHQHPFEKVIVHGHTPMVRPEVKTNRINVDTCCYDTGVLTAVVLEENRHRFIATGA